MKFISKRTERGSKKPVVQAHAIFQPVATAEDGPSPRASLISLSLHAGAAIAIFGFLHFSLPPVARKPVRITMLHEARLLAPPPKHAEPADAGASSGNEQKLVASKGELPRPTNLRAPMPLRVMKLNPILPVSPAIIDSAPPPIEENFQYGNPLAQASTLSPGPGWSDVGGGSTPGSRGSASGRLSHGLGSLFGRVVYRMSELSTIPVLVYKVAPDYSDEARAARCHGTVLLGVIIDETGKPRDIHVLKPLGLGLDEKAVEAVQRWRFSPGLKDGQPVCVAANVEVNFQLL